MILEKISKHDGRRTYRFYHRSTAKSFAKYWGSIAYQGVDHWKVTLKVSNQTKSKQ